MKKALCFAVACLLVGAVCAEVNPDVTTAGSTPQNVEFKGNVWFTAPSYLWDSMTLNSGGSVDISDGALKVDTISESTAGSGVTIDGVTMKDGAVTTTSASISTPTALTVTNGQTVTVQSGTYLVTAGGSANAFTNTLTVANGEAGTEVRFVMDGTSTNLLKFADATGNLQLSGDALLGTNDVMRLYAPTASKWVEDGHIDN